MCDRHLSPEVSESCLSPGMSSYFARGWGEGLPRKPEPKAIWVLHVGTRPGVGTLEADLQRLRVLLTSRIQERVLLTFLPGHQSTQGPGRWVCAQLGSVTAGLAQLAAYAAAIELSTLDPQVRPGCLPCDLFVLHPLDSSAELNPPPSLSCPPSSQVAQPLPAGLPPAQVAGPHATWNLGKKGFGRECVAVVEGQAERRPGCRIWTD